MIRYFFLGVVFLAGGALTESREMAVVYAAGEVKWPVIDRLETDLPAAEQPAQILKLLSKLTIFTDRPQRKVILFCMLQQRRFGVASIALFVLRDPEENLCQSRSSRLL